jgi:hypothetical protein
VGSYSEEITHIFVNSTKGSFPWSSTPLTSSTLNGTDIYYNEDMNIEVLSTNGIPYSYGVSNETMVQTVAMFDDIFPSYVTARSISEEPLMWNKIYVTQKGPMTRRLLSNPWMVKNVTEYMARLATALTNAMRSSRPNEKRMLGDTWRDEIFISVRWA